VEKNKERGWPSLGGRRGKELEDYHIARRPRANHSLFEGKALVPDTRGRGKKKGDRHKNIIRAEREKKRGLGGGGRGGLSSGFGARLLSSKKGR